MNRIFRDPHGVWWMIEGRGIRRVPVPSILRRLLTRLRRAWAWLKGE